MILCGVMRKKKDLSLCCAKTKNVFQSQLVGFSQIQFFRLQFFLFFFVSFKKSNSIFLSCFMREELKKNWRTDEEKKNSLNCSEDEEEACKKKIDFHSLWRKDKRGGRRNYAKNKQTPLGSVAFREHTKSIHSIDFPTLGNNSNVNFHRYRRTPVRI